jgi:hypothetical protein
LLHVAARVAVQLFEPPHRIAGAHVPQRELCHPSADSATIHRRDHGTALEWSRC